MDKIYFKDQLLGIKVTSIPEGSIPTTDGDAPLQLVTLKHPAGAKLVPHLHKDVTHTTGAAETCFVVKKGEINIDVYTSEKEFATKINLKEGDVFITLNGSGHGIEILEDSEILEIKNGPYIEDKILI